MTNNLVWLNPKTMGHTYGLEILSRDKTVVEQFVYDEIVPLCRELNCHYFIQGWDVHNFGVSWAFVEFFGEGDESKILDLIVEFNKRHGYIYFNGEVMMDEPSRELLGDLNLY